jgi:hypothetical protein
MYFTISTYFLIDEDFRKDKAIFVVWKLEDNFIKFIKNDNLTDTFTIVKLLCSPASLFILLSVWGIW